MILAIILTFSRICLTLTPESKLLNNLGLSLVYHDEPISFYGGHRTVIWSRVYSNPCIGLPLDLIRTTLKSDNCKAVPERHIISNLERFQKFCQNEWERKVDHLRTYRDQEAPTEDIALEAKVKRLSKVSQSVGSRKRRSQQVEL